MPLSPGFRNECGRQPEEEKPEMPNDPFVGAGDLTSLGPLRYLEVRDQVAFDPAHAPGAVRVPLDEWDAAAKRPPIPASPRLPTGTTR